MNWRVSTGWFRGKGLKPFLLEDKRTVPLSFAGIKGLSLDNWREPGDLETRYLERESMRTFGCSPIE